MTITNTATTSATPRVVASVMRQRTRRLRRLYFSGTAIALIQLPQPLHDGRLQVRVRRYEATDDAQSRRDQESTGENVRCDLELDEEPARERVDVDVAEQGPRPEAAEDAAGHRQPERFGEDQSKNLRAVEPD